MIIRDFYLQKLRALKGTNLIKVITGVRRSGKSTLMNAFKTELIESGISEDNIIYINFEERGNLNFHQWEVLYDDITRNISTTNTSYVFLDEVQLLDDFEKLINALFTQKKLDIYVTGSNAYLLSSELATLLTGRYISINVQPFSFYEYVLANPNVNNIDKLFRLYLNSSCFPEAVNLSKQNDEMVNNYLQSIYDTVVIRDIATRYNLRNIHNLRRVISFVFDSVGSLISPSNIATHLNKNSKKSISHNTVNKYLDFLTNAFILYSVPRYNIKGKELLSRNEKYYVIDLGLKNIVNTNKYDSDLGHKLENIIYFELLRRGGLVYTGSFNGKEIDFVVQKPNNQREYYQVAFTVSDKKTLMREISALQQIRDNYPKYLLTMDPDQGQIEGIIKLNIIDWLTKF